MYDDDIKVYMNQLKGKQKPFVILGTCNPHFAKVRAYALMNIRSSVTFLLFFILRKATI